MKLIFQGILGSFYTRNQVRPRGFVQVRPGVIRPHTPIKFIKILNSFATPLTPFLILPERVKNHPRHHENPTRARLKFVSIYRTPTNSRARLEPRPLQVSQLQDHATARGWTQRQKKIRAHLKRPRGKSPRGMSWDGQTGAWVKQKKQQIVEKD